MTLPSGTLTFLFTDIVGSTKLWETHPQAMRQALERHDTLLRQAIHDHQGHVFKTVGDAFCAAFPSASEALHAALSAHLQLQAQEWEPTGPLHVRIGLHTGAAQERDNDYFGPTLNRVARLQALGHGQQTLLSQATYELVKDRLPPQTTLEPLGRHRLKDLQAPEHVWHLRHPDLPQTYPPLKSLDRFPHNLPFQLSTFIGREQQLQQVQERLAARRLVTLTGIGGCGKTRLSLQVGAEILEQYPDGVWLVELAALSDPSLIAGSVVAVLGIREEPGRPLLQTLTDYLHSRTLLLILDNCEHLLAGCASLVETLLRTAPQVRVLASSREPLNITGEQTYRLPSLSLPDLRSATPERLSQSEAGRLFVERACLAIPEFAVTAANAGAVARLCHRLDGIPLALELAAARLRSLSVEEILQRLDQRFRLLTGGSRTALPRQQTLRALIDWSYDLLNPPEQALLRRLSVFAGGWTLAAAEKVCAETGKREEGDTGKREKGKGKRDDAPSFPSSLPSFPLLADWEILDLLSSLVDKSLVLAEAQEGTVRYRLLETMRDYAAEQLAASEEETALRSRHLDWCLALAEEAEPKLRGPEQALWLERLDTEHDNLRAALDWSLEEGKREKGKGKREEEAKQAERDDDPSFPFSLPSFPLSEVGLRLCGELVDFWHLRGLAAEGSRRLAGLLDAAEEAGPSLPRARALLGMGTLTEDQGDHSAAQGYYTQSLQIARSLGEKSLIAAALQSLGGLARFQGDYAAARAALEESLQLLRAEQRLQEVAFLLQNLGLVARDQGDYPASAAFYQQSLAILRELGDRRGAAKSLVGLGFVAQAQEAYAVARAHYEEGLATMRELGARGAVGTLLTALGNVALRQQDDAAARALFTESLTLFRDLNNKPGIADALAGLGILARNQGDWNGAYTCYAESLALQQELGGKAGIAWLLEEFAALALAQGQPERATRLDSAAEALRAAIGAPRPAPQQREHSERITTLRQTLGEPAFQQAWEAGRALPWEHAAHDALAPPTN